MSADLKALQSVDFDWTTHIDSIWRDLPYDVPNLQDDLRREAVLRVETLFSNAAASPLGMVLAGPSGSGKTHLLSLLRRNVLQRGAFFVLVDMTDVRDFWETVLLGYVRALSQSGNENQSQCERVLRGLTAHAATDVTFEALQKSRPPALIKLSDTLIFALRRKLPKLQEHQDTLRALILFGSDDPIVHDLGWKWLQAVGIDDNEKVVHGFQKNVVGSQEIIRGLSMLMSVVGPTMLALDQLDAIVAELQILMAVEKDAERNQRQLAALAIIQGIATGLITLRDRTARTQTVVACLEQTWASLHARATFSMQDRFFPPLPLRPIVTADQVKQLIELRLLPAYRSSGFKPKYPTYPFRPGFFVSVMGLSPREVLKLCDAHRWNCLRVGKVSQLDDPPGLVRSGDDGIEGAKQRFQELVRAANVERLLEAEDEEALDKLLETACKALEFENPVPSDIDVIIDLDFEGAAKYVPLHARMRVLYRAEGDRERHYATRFLQKKHASAFQARLKAAMTASGIDHQLEFRRLALFRCGPVPKGAATAQLLEDLKARGGTLIQPAIEELRALWALSQLLLPGSDTSHVRDWLCAEPVVSQLVSFKDAAHYLFGDATQRSTVAQSMSPAVNSASVTEGNGSVPPVRSSPAPDPGQLFVGMKLVAGAPKGPLTLPIENLAKHTVVLAGAGSGKTVLVRRLVEEAALLGVPSIVIDGANDLSRLGDRWPATPDSFNDSDREKASRYHDQADVIVWTPGRETGNPLMLEPLPDFAEVGPDPDDLQSALDMARSSLEPFIASGKGADKKRGVLAGALRYFASLGGGSLREFISLLSELPSDANAGFEKADKLARDMGESLLAAMETNPLLRSSGASLDVAKLITSRESGKVRVSVVNLSGLPDLPAQQQFVNQLAITMFSWIKRHPPRGRALQGLLVVDEARDFVPSGKAVPGKDALIRLAAQGRKYGLGIVFATQAPKSIDHNVIANCSTHFYGRANSPAAIDTIQNQLRDRGAAGGDIAKLTKGVFYAFSEGVGAPQKVATSLCLSHHPANPPEEAEILKRAAQCRSRV